MPKPPRKSPSPKPRKPTERGMNRTGSLKEFGDSTAGIVQQATSVLEDEVAAGIKAAREVERSIREERELRPEQLDDIFQRLRSDAHDLVTIVGDRTEELRSRESDDLIRRLRNDAHDAVDLMLDLLGTFPQLLEKFRPAPAGGAAASGRTDQV